MKPYLTLSVLLLAGVPLLAQAQDAPLTPTPPTPAVVPPLDASNIDATQWCVYASALYSDGAIINIGDEVYMCTEQVDTEAAQNPQRRPRLVWRLVD